MDKKKKPAIRQIIIMTLLALGTSAFSQNQTKKALLVIDVQENLLKPLSKLHVDPVTVTPLLENLYKSIAAFQEKNYPVIYTINEWTNPILNLLTGNVCKKGSAGTGIDKRVMMASNMIYYKSRSSALTNKELRDYLKKESITELYITGLFAEACIKGTQKGAARNNFKVVIIENAVGSRSAKNKLKSMEYCRRNGAILINADQLFDTK